MRSSQLTLPKEDITMDFTHDMRRVSWVPSAAEHQDYPLQNLPFGVFRPRDGVSRVGIAIGDAILDVSLAVHLFDDEAKAAASACASGDLANLMNLGVGARKVLRRAVSELLAVNTEAGRKAHAHSDALIHMQHDCVMQLPTRIGDYTDFYAGIHHAINVGKLFRPDSPLLPNYRYVPVGYHGRASTICVSSTPVRRPRGQILRKGETAPTFTASERLDYEVELAMWIGKSNAIGVPVPVGDAADVVWGFSLLNDWSARDIQAWEYQPLGPFLAKSFATTVSPWIVTPEALEPYRSSLASRWPDDPPVLPYLDDPNDAATGAIDMEIEASLSSEHMRARGIAPYRLSQVNSRQLYWTFAQFVAHHTSNGCALSVGDLFGSGTISGPDRCSAGSLLELTAGGSESLILPDGEPRKFLADGDEVIFKAHCTRKGFARIGFGECRAVVEPTISLS